MMAVRDAHSSLMSTFLAVVLEYKSQLINPA
jgi:hypothetical protein